MVGNFSTTPTVNWTIGGLSLSDAATAPYTVEANAIDLLKEFSASTAEAGGTVNAIFTLSNFGDYDVQNVSFDDELESFLAGTTATSVVSNTCSGTLDIATDNSIVDLVGATLAADASCVIEVALAISAGAALGVHTNTTSTLSGLIQTDESIGELEILVYANPASADLTVTAANSATFEISFSPDAIAATETTTLTYTITNPSAGTLSNLNFSNNIEGFLPSGTIGTINSSACSGAFAGAGTGLLTGSSISIAPTSSCIVSIVIQTGFAPNGIYTNTTTDVTSNGLTIAPAASDTLDFTYALPGISKSFDTASMQEGEVTTLTLTLDNTGMPIAAGTVSITDTFPAGLFIATPSNASTTCTGGTLTATADGVSVSYTGGSIAANSSCTIVADVTSITDGNYVNTTGDLISTLGNSGTASASLEVTDTPEPTFTKAFGVASMPQGDTTSLTLTLSNVDSFLDATTIDFTDTFPTGLLVSTPSDAATTCTAGTLTATAGSGDTSPTGSSR